MHAHDHQRTSSHAAAAAFAKVRKRINQIRTINYTVRINQTSWTAVSTSSFSIMLGRQFVSSSFTYISHSVKNIHYITVVSFCIDHTKHPFQSIPVQFERPNIMPKNNSREVLPFKNPVSVWNEHLRYKEQITNSNGHGIVCVRVECIHNSTPNWLDDNGWGVCPFGVTE